MPRLNVVQPEQAQGPAKELLDKVKTTLGRVPNMMKAMANSPAVLQAYIGFSAALRGDSLGPKLREQISLGVAQANGCGYCLDAHTALGQRVGLTTAQMVASRRWQAEDPKAQAALQFARRLVENHGNVTSDTVREAQSAGFTDGEMAEILAHVALDIFTNYFNVAFAVESDYPAAMASQR